jgi:hypothetical protein
VTLPSARANLSSFTKTPQFIKGAGRLLHRNRLLTIAPVCACNEGDRGHPEWSAQGLCTIFTGQFDEEGENAIRAGFE